MKVATNRVSEHITQISVVEEGKVFFESLWETGGVRYNSYVLESDKGYILIDTAPKEARNKYLETLTELTDWKIEYIVVNHLEPDHSGLLKDVAERSGAKIVLSFIGGTMFGIKNALLVKQGGTISVGEVKLKFYPIPWVHWPETMFTYLENEGTLFTGDMLGAFGLNTSLDETYLYNVAKYTASVLMGYKKQVLGALDLIKDVKPSAVAPAHGLVLRGKEIEKVTNYLKEAIERPRGVIVVYGSMYGSTARLATNLARETDGEAIDVLNTPLSEILTAFLLSEEIYIVFPTYESDPYPLIKFVVEIAAKKHLFEGKLVHLVNTYLWSPSVEALKRIIESAGAKEVSTRTIRGSVI